MSISQEMAEQNKPDLFCRFGIWCSGASTKALYQCPTEWNKYAFNGYIIFLTASLAMLSGTYFLSFVFPEANMIVPVLFGLLWGFLIFTLDRIIIVSMKKNGGIWKQLLQGGLWRLILAVFIGLVIATPLELRLFEKEIEVKVRENNQIRLTQKQEEIARRDNIYRSNMEAMYKSIRLKYNLDNLEADEKEKRIKYENLDKQRIDEAEGVGGTRKKGKGPVYAEKLASFNIAKKDWEKAKEELQNAKEKYDKDISMLKPPIDTVTYLEKTVDGPEARVKALYQLSGIHWFLTLLFILIECLPVITKLMTPRGPYDEIVEQAEYDIFIAQKEIISRKNSEINELLRRAEEAAVLSGNVMIQMQKDKLDAELRNNREILDDIAQKQLNLAKIAIQNWYDDELSKL